MSDETIEERAARIDAATAHVAMTDDEVVAAMRDLWPRMLAGRISDETAADLWAVLMTLAYERGGDLFDRLMGVVNASAASN